MSNESLANQTKEALEKFDSKPVQEQVKASGEVSADLADKAPAEIKLNYCPYCNDKLTENFYCITCERHFTNYFGEHINERNEKPWIERAKTWGYSTYPSQHYICHICKYFMFHPLNYCYCCGQLMANEKLTNTELMNKYADYKMGY